MDYILLILLFVSAILFGVGSSFSTLEFLKMIGIVGMVTTVLILAFRWMERE